MTWRCEVYLVPFMTSGVGDPWGVPHLPFVGAIRAISSLDPCTPTGLQGSTVVSSMAVSAVNAGGRSLVARLPSWCLGFRTRTEVCRFWWSANSEARPTQLLLILTLPIFLKNARSTCAMVWISRSVVYPPIVDMSFGSVDDSAATTMNLFLALPAADLVAKWRS